MFNPQKREVTKAFPIPDAGVAPARCVRVVEIGEHDTSYGMKNVVMITFELGIEGFEYKGEVKPFWISHSKLNLSSNPESTLMKWVDVLNPKATSLEEVLDKECFINVIHNEQGDKTFANIGGVTPIMKGVSAPELVNEALYFSFTDPTVEAWDKLNDWEKKQIQSANNYLGSKVQSLVESESPPPAVDNQATPAERPF